jgi:L-lactate dehydrogenase complex protein LldG
MNRDAFLARIRDAVRAGNSAPTPPLPQRPGALGYQGGGPDPVARLREELTAAGGTFHLAASTSDVIDVVLRLVRERSARRALLGYDLPKLESALLAAGIEVHHPDETQSYFDADIGITGVDAVVAETGSIVLNTLPDQPRALSLLPPIHIAIAERSQLVADLFDLFPVASPPACMTVITGPSKTGDIELKLVTGVHGPGEVHLIFVGG